MSRIKAEAIAHVLTGAASMGPIIAAEQRAAWDREHSVITTGIGEKIALTVDSPYRLDRRPKPLRTRLPKSTHAEEMAARRVRQLAREMTDAQFHDLRDIESRHKPHQGTRECTRRLQQAAWRELV